jgi:hypothetical protein
MAWACCRCVCQLALADRAGLQQVEPDVQSDLVVAGSAGVQLPADVSDQLDQPALDCRMHILIGLEELESVVGRIGGELVERRVDGGVFFCRDEANVCQHPDVGDRAADVDGQKTPVGLRGRVPPEDVGRGVVESAAPQCHAATLLLPPIRHPAARVGERIHPATPRRRAAPLRAGGAAARSVE